MPFVGQGAVDIGVPAFWVQLYGPGRVSNGSRIVAFAVSGFAAVQVSPSVFRGETDHLVRVSDHEVKTASPEIRRAPIGVRRRILRIEADGGVCVGNGGGVILLCQINRTSIQARRCILGVETDRLREVLCRRVVVSLAGIGHPRPKYPSAHAGSISITSVNTRRALL